MRAVTDTFAEAIGRSHKLSTLVQILSDSEAVDTLDVLEASVTLDQRAAIRGRLDLRFTDPDGTMIPTEPTDLLAPYGNELRPWRGIEYPDGSVERVSLGIFRIETVSVSDEPDGLSVAIQALDRGQIVEDAAFEDPYSIASGTLFTEAIIGLVEESGLTEIETDFVASGLTTPTLVAEEGSSRWAMALAMAHSIGMDLYFDGDGVLVLRPVTTGDAVRTIAEGEDGVMLSGNAEWTRERAANRWIVTGENTGSASPARGIATDDDTSSPTRYGGPFGVKPVFHSSSFIVTDTQAQDAAEAMMAREMGTTRQVDFGALVDPALEPGDVVRIRRERLGVDEDHVLDQVTIPLGAEGTMTGRTRAIQVIG